MDVRRQAQADWVTGQANAGSFRGTKFDTMTTVELETHYARGRRVACRMH